MDLKQKGRKVDTESIHVMFDCDITTTRGKTLGER